MAICLVLGGGRFVGRAIAKRLVAEGNEVYVLNRGNHPTPKGCKQLIADRNDPDQLAAALEGLQFDFVYDSSAYTPQQTRLAIQCLVGRVKHFLHISTAAVYQDTEEFPLTESSPAGFNKFWGEYGIEKYRCEQELLKSFREDGFPVTIFRPFYIYGPGNNLDRETYVFRRLLNNAPIILPGMGRSVIQFGHIDDLVDTLIDLTGKPESFGEIYNVTGEEAVTMQGWVKKCAEVIGVTPQIFLVEAKEVGYTPKEWFPFRDIHFFGSIQKLSQQFGLRPRYSLLEGLQQTLEKTSKEYLKQSFTPSEVELDILQKIGASR